MTVQIQPKRVIRGYIVSDMSNPNPLAKILQLIPSSLAFSKILLPSLLALDASGWAATNKLLLGLSLLWKMLDTVVARFACPRYGAGTLQISLRVVLFIALGKVRLLLATASIQGPPLGTHDGQVVGEGSAET
jgi:hypothetical protein